jgi:hypothetical protein
MTTAQSSLFFRILQFPLTRLVLLGAILFYMYLSGHVFRAQYAPNPLANLAIVAWMLSRKGHVVPPIWMRSRD